jgi:hypothetical protein
VESKSASTTSPPTNLAFSAFGTARGVRTFAFSFFCDLPTDSFHSIRAVRWAQTNGSLLPAVRFLSCYIERRPSPTPLTPPSRRHPSFFPRASARRAARFFLSPPRSKREREREGEARDIGDGGGAEVPRGRAGDAGRARPPRRLHARVRVRESRAGREMLEEGEGASGGPLPDGGDDPEGGGRVGGGGGSARDGVHRRDEVRWVLAGVGRAGEGGRRPRPQLPRGDAGHRPLRHGEDHQQPPSGTSAILIAPRWVSFVTCSALVVTKSFDR